MTWQTCDINNILIQSYLRDIAVWFQTPAMKHYCDSATKSCPNLCDPMNCSMPSLSPRVCSNSCPSIQCYLTISSFATPFSFCSQSSPASGSFPMSWFLLSGVQSIGASPSTSFLPMNIQGWFPLGFTDFLSLQSKGLSRVFFSNTIWKYQFFGAEPSLWSNSHIHTWLLEKNNHSFDSTDLCQQSVVSAF